MFGTQNTVSLSEKLEDFSKSADGFSGSAVEKRTRDEAAPGSEALEEEQD